MNKTICVNVAWEKTMSGEILVLKTHEREPIEMAYVYQTDKAFFGMTGHYNVRKKTLEEVKQNIEIAIFGKPATFSNLPEMTQQPLMSVDVTPNSGLTLRILEAYRTNCDCNWRTSEPNPLWDKMNQDNSNRAVLLDKAIKKLEEKK